jgi:hypothetical protein
MEPMTIAMLAGAGLGALKSQEEKNIWADQQKAEAEKTRYAPWTGQWGQNLPGPKGDLANMAFGASVGAGLSQGMSADPAKADNSQTSLTSETEPTQDYSKYSSQPMYLNQSNMSGAATGDDFQDWLQRKHTNVDYKSP